MNNMLNNVALAGDKGALFRLVVGDDFSISMEICLLVWAPILLILFLVCCIKSSGWLKVKQMEVDEAEIGIGNQKIKLKPNVTDSQIAFKIWVELSTRKIGMPVELDKDVIIEIYNSWYQFFGITRELIKDIPVRKLMRKETEAVVKLSIDVLNNGVRPHLTEWQAKFRRWYAQEMDSEGNKDKTPQEIQRDYPRYDQLAEDLKDVNRRLIEYRKAMRKLAFLDG